MTLDTISAGNQPESDPIEVLKQQTENKEKHRFSFRRATPEDADAYMELESTTIGDHRYSRSTDKAEAIQEFAEHQVYLIHKGERLVGSVQFQMEDTDNAYISGMIVHPDLRGARVAYEAVEFLKEKLHGAKKIWLVTHPENKNMLSISQKMGFKVVEEVADYYGDGEPRVKLVKEN